MRSVFLVLSLIAAFEQARADHPNEGSLALQSLVDEAVLQNKELAAWSQQIEALKHEYSAANGAYYPEVSIEGGPLETKFDGDKNSGLAAYGKVEWNLYRGGRDAAVRDVKKLELDQAERQLNQSKVKLAGEVSKVYYDMLFLLESVSLKEKAIAMNQDQIKLAKLKNTSGFTSSSDVIEFELREATLRSDLKQLQQDKTDKSRELSVLLGRKEPMSDLGVRGHLQKVVYAADRNRLFADLEASNPDIVEMRTNKQRAEREKRISNSGFYPKIDLEGRFGKIANEERVFSDRDNYSVFLKFKMPLFSGFATSNEVSASVAKIKGTESLVEQRSLAGRAELESILTRLDTIQERLALEEKTLQRSEDYYKITLGEYRRGVKNSPDMVGAAERLLNARIRNLEYRRDFYLARLRIYQLTNSPIDKIIQ